MAVTPALRFLPDERGTSPPLAVLPLSLAQPCPRLNCGSTHYQGRRGRVAVAVAVAAGKAVAEAGREMMV